MLTDAAIRAAKPREHAYEVTAGGCPGLKLRITPKGQKSWTLRYRTPAGDRRRYTLGRYPALKLKAARAKGLEVQASIAQGVDPNDARARERDALRMVDLFGSAGDEGWFLSTYVKTAGRLGTAKTKRSIITDRSYINRHLRNRRALMRKRMDEVTTGDLNRIKQTASDGAWRKVRNILRVAFKHAVELGAVEPHRNPILKTRAAPETRHERYLEADERRRLEEELVKAEHRGPRVRGGLGKSNIRAIRLLLLTGMRRGEVLDLTWADVDWARGCLHLRSSKTGQKTVPLTPQALDFLRGERADRIRRGRVCPGPDGVRLENLDRAWRKLRKVAGLSDVRLHDLRHSWASDALSEGVPLAIIGKVLGHRHTSTTARYAHLHDPELTSALAVVGRRIEARSTASGEDGGGAK